MVRINGDAVNADGLLLGSYLDQNGYERKKVAVECNEEIIPRAEFDSYILKDGDVVEVVSFVGGG